MTPPEVLRDIAANHPEFPHGVIVDLESVARKFEELEKKAQEIESRARLVHASTFPDSAGITFRNVRYAAYYILKGETS